MNFVKLSLDSYPVKYYKRTHKVTNTLKLTGVGLKTSDEEEIKKFFKKLDISCMAYLIDKEDIIYLEFYKKKECSHLFSYFNHTAQSGTLPCRKNIKAEYTNIKYEIKNGFSNVYTRDITKLLKKDGNIFVYPDAIDEDSTAEITRSYQNENWKKYTKNDEINICHYFFRSNPNRIYKSYCIQNLTAFFSSDFLTKIKKLLSDKQPNQISILKCHVKKSIEYVIESSYIFEDEIAFLVLENDLPMSFLDIRNEVKDNLLIPKNTFIRIKGRLRYELLFGIPKKKSVQMENTVVERQNSYLLVFRFIDEEKLKTMLTQKRKNEIVKDEKQEKDCISIDVNDYTSEDLEKKYVLDVYNKIAQHFCYTRYKSWNNVENIINQEKEGNIIIDVGCGNGKNVKASSKYFFIGLDFSFYLLKWAQRKHNTDLFLANCISIPLRSNIADLCISIAVIHHIGTHEKRKAVAEMVRCVKVGGRVLIYVWAYEQQENVVGNRKFDSQDIFVPWYLQPQHTLETSYNEAERQAEQQVEQQVEQPAEQPAERQEEEAYREVRPCYPAKKDLLKLQRYYHVFRKEELYELCTSIDGVQVEEFFFDCNNWAIVLRKIF
ncbi:methyltransferase, putative [Plasmodium ovale]|uniref:Methyltransferase, putative n=1 Tax=Plasmodium ovale TaxID=36330 RepID=A0A1C3KPV7_PLAOA|nr:methyltransferase, putative [Plasmodium ovale]